MVLNRLFITFYGIITGLLSANYSCARCNCLPSHDKLYQVLPDPAGLLSAFQASNCPTTWSFLLHVALSHLKDMAVSVLKVQTCRLALFRVVKIWLNVWNLNIMLKVV